MIDFEHRVTDLEVAVGSEHSAHLRRRSQFEFEYLPTATRQASLLMPLEDRLFRDGELFAAMDMNLPRRGDEAPHAAGEVDAEDEIEATKHRGRG